MLLGLGLLLKGQQIDKDPPGEILFSGPSLQVGSGRGDRGCDISWNGRRQQKTSTNDSTAACQSRSLSPAPG